jgi:hypothetical protein
VSTVLILKELIRKSSNLLYIQSKIANSSGVICIQYGISAALQVKVRRQTCINKLADGRGHGGVGQEGTPI